MSDPIKKLRELYQEILTIEHIDATVQYDEESGAPSGSSDDKSRQLSYLAGLIHRVKTNPEIDANLKLAADMDLNFRDKRMVELMRRDYDLATLLPEELVKKRAELNIKATQAWREARSKSDFSIFQLYLEQQVELARERAYLVSKSDEGYNALLDIFEPDATVDFYDKVFGELREFLIEVIPRIRERQKDLKSLEFKDIPKQPQVDFTQILLEHNGFEFDRGQLFETAHPFSITLGIGDNRVSNRYNETNMDFISSAVHEGGHALYNQGLDPNMGLSREGQDYSIGFHESQSRIWEVYACHTRAYWEPLYPELQKHFPAELSDVSLDQWIQHLTYVQPSAIRVEADEVTYSLHVIIRYEIERDLMRGELEVKDIPKVWNAKYKEYLGYDVKNDAEGCLQDVHWSWGEFGYFPTYAFGNLMAAQFWLSYTENNQEWEEEFRSGNAKGFREWLRENIHSKGSLYPSLELVKEVTGREFSLEPFKRHIREKYLGG
jgi:carboxypeptidase Taq